MKSTTTCAQAVAPEDIRVGDYLIVLHTTYELLPMLLGCESSFAPPKPTRMTLMSWDTEPKRVVRICLPIILVLEPDGEKDTIDVRRHNLARVDLAFGRTAFKKKEKLADELERPKRRNRKDD